MNSTKQIIKALETDRNSAQSYQSVQSHNYSEEILSPGPDKPSWKNALEHCLQLKKSIAPKIDY